MKYVLTVIFLLIFSDMNGIPDAILKLQTGKCLFVGKIVEVTRVIFFSHLVRRLVSHEVPISRRSELALLGARFALHHYGQMSWKILLPTPRNGRISVWMTPYSYLSRMKICARIWRARLVLER